MEGSLIEEPERDAVGTICAVAADHAVDVDRAGRFPEEAVEAMRQGGLLGAAVPRALGGLGLSLARQVEACDRIARACASSAMILAMHWIQVGSIARHVGEQEELGAYLSDVALSQRLIGSVTSEVGVGGELRRSIASVMPGVDGDFALSKEASASSYCEQADDLLVTARRGPDAAPSDQVAVLLREGDFRLSDVGAWDTLGMRGTCSPPATVTGGGRAWQILETPFHEIAHVSMVPLSHVLWSGVWCGIARDAIDRARRFVRAKARKDPEGSFLARDRLARATSRLSGLVARRDALVDAIVADRLSGPRSALEVSSLKVVVSEEVVDVVTEALRAIGIAAYRDDGEYGLGRHLRDAHSAWLMINNDRIRQSNADLLSVIKGD